ncbi:biotin/lipoyl-binding protein [Hymenobacter sp. BT559]|nr:biotin/lipoyl-binding protein [Hymenobacter sp. BT559]
MTVQPRTAEMHTDYPTVLQGQADVEIRPKEEGFIDQVLVDEGAHVRKGQLLFRLNSGEADQQVRAVQSAVLSAQIPHRLHHEESSEAITSSRRVRQAALCTGTETSYGAI